MTSRQRKPPSSPIRRPPSRPVADARGSDARRAESSAMSDAPQAEAGLIYGLDDKPGLRDSLLAAIQHLLASVVAIATPTLVIGEALDLGDRIPFLISMSLMV